MRLNLRTDLNSNEIVNELGQRLIDKTAEITEVLREIKYIAMKMERYEHIENITDMHAQRNYDLSGVNACMEHTLKIYDLGRKLRQMTGE